MDKKFPGASQDFGETFARDRNLKMPVAPLPKDRSTMSKTNHDGINNKIPETNNTRAPGPYGKS